MIPLQFEQKLRKNAVRGKPHVRICDVRAMDVAEQLQWAHLSADAGDDGIFACDWFVRPVLQHFDPQDAYRLFVAVDADGRWYGAMPIARAEHFGRIPVRNWRNLRNANQFLGLPLVRPGKEQQFWEVFLNTVDDIPGGAFAFYASELPADHRITKALLAVCDAQQRDVETIGQYQRAVIDTDLDFASYWAKAVSKKRQKRLKGLSRQLEAQHGPVSHSIVTDIAGLDRWIEDFLALELAGWKGRSGSAIASSADSTALFRAVVQSGFADGKIACVALRLGEQPIAMSSYFIALGHGFGFKNCFDESFARYAPGILLVREIMTILDSGQRLHFDSCAAANEKTVSDLWLERRQMLDLCIGLKGRAAKQRFTLVVGLRRRWHRAKLALKAIRP
jgi:CelD/BcsL family acetyltransferase involved in cellulose biosynthesis